MKFLIITINDINNYGNRLQNYALENMLGQFGEATTVQMRMASDTSGMLYIRRIKDRLLPLRIVTSNMEMGGLAVRCARLRNFRQFSRHLNNEYFELSNVRGLLPANKEVTRYVIGSDQVWNYNWIGTDDLKLRLGYAFEGSKILTYAASIGVDTIDENLKEVFSKGWNRIGYISVREDSAANLVKLLSNRDVPIVLDPTLMLSCEQWSKVFTGFVPESDRYILTYFLGRPSADQEKVILSLANKLGVRVRRINDLHDRETYSAGPAEFVELFSKARYVFTDSYHACCFSILFNIPFKVFSRAGFSGASSMNSRMKTLFRLFELDDLMGEDAALPEFDWARVNKLLLQHRRESLAWLEGALLTVQEGDSDA